MLLLILEFIIIIISGLRFIIILTVNVYSFKWILDIKEDEDLLLHIKKKITKHLIKFDPMLISGSGELHQIYTYFRFWLYFIFFITCLKATLLLGRSQILRTIFDVLYIQNCNLCWKIYILTDITFVTHKKTGPCLFSNMVLVWLFLF